MSVTGTRLLVLGFVRLRGPVHGYHVRQELLVQWGAGRWYNLLPGSVYNQLRTLSKAGFIELDSVEQDPSRPERSLYRLTQSGEREFHHLISEILFDPNPQPLDLWPVLCFLPAVKESDLRRALAERIERITAWLSVYDAHVANSLEASPAPHIVEAFEFTNAALSSEVAWATRLLTRMDEGRYTFAPE